MLLSLRDHFLLPAQLPKPPLASPNAQELSPSQNEAGASHILSAKKMEDRISLLYDHRRQEKVLLIRAIKSRPGPQGAREHTSIGRVTF